jgi:flagellar hook-associated protein 2
MAGISLSGLASGMDWKTTVDQLMSIEQVPQDNLKKQQAAAARTQTAFDTLKTNLTALQTAASALSTGITGFPRSAKVSGGSSTTNGVTTNTDASTASVTTDSGATVGQFSVAVSQMGNPSTRVGTSLYPSQSAASALTLSDYGVTAGTFTINGTQYTIQSADLTQSISTIFGLSSGNGYSSSTLYASTSSTGTSANNTVPNFTASLDSTTGALTLSAGDGDTANVGSYGVGSAGDTSNILSVLGFSSATESNGYVTTSQKMPINALARVSMSSLSSYGSSFSGSSLTINGVSVGTFSDSDTLASVISAINSYSSTGVTASLDASSGKLRLTSNSVGGTGISVSVGSSGLSTALGMDASTFTRGSGTTFSITDPSGGVVTGTSDSSTVDFSKFGYGATKLTVATSGNYFVTVAGSASDYKSKVDTFVSAFNDLKKMLDDSTKITVGSDGKVTPSIFSNRSDINNLLTAIRSKIYSQVKDPSAGGSSNYSTLSSTYDSASKIGLGFNSNGLLSVQDAAKLSYLLSTTPSSVDAVLNAGSGGIALTAQSGTSSGSSSVSLSSVSGLVVGQGVSGTGITTGTYITAIDSYNSTITLSASHSLSSGSTLYYTPPSGYQGIATRIKNLMSTLTGSSGLVASATASLTTQTKRLQTQIDSMTRSLAQKKAALTRSFIQMEQAQSSYNNMSSQLTSALK